MIKGRPWPKIKPHAQQAVTVGAVDDRWPTHIELAVAGESANPPEKP